MQVYHSKIELIAKMFLKNSTILLIGQPPDWMTYTYKFFTLLLNSTKTNIAFKNGVHWSEKCNFIGSSKFKKKNLSVLQIWKFRLIVRIAS